MRVIKIKLHGGGTYVQPANEIHNAIQGELDSLLSGDLDFADPITITFEAMDMSEEEYKALPEFEGH